MSLKIEKTESKDTVIFDLDGTLLNTLDDLADSVNFALEELDYPTRTREEIRNFVGNGVAVLVELAIPDGKNNPDFEKCLAIFKRHYANNMENKTAPYDGIMNMLTAVKSKGFKTAIVSNKFDLAVKNISNKFFGELIDYALGESDKIKRKPAPDSICKALEELNSDISRAIYVGDSEVDCITARNADIDLVAVSWGFRSVDTLRENGATVILDTPSQLAKHLLSKQ